MEAIKELCNFFRKLIKIQKIIKNTKKVFKYHFLNEAGYMFGLIYVYSRINFLQFQFKTSYFLNFDQILKFAWDSGDGDDNSDCDRHSEF